MADVYLGQIMMGGFNFAPRGFAACNGQLLPIAQNQALFALLGTAYGGTAVPPLPCLTCKAVPQLARVLRSMARGNHRHTRSVHGRGRRLSPC